MRKVLSLAAVAALAGCGGGGGAAAPSVPAPTHAPVTQSGFVTPQFVIVVPPAGSTTSSRRAPSFVSTATQSVTITLTSVDGSSSNLPTPSSVTTDINGSSCASGCTVNGPASPPGTDAYTVTTYDGTGGAPGHHALDTGSTTTTIAPGANATINIVLMGIPASVTIGNVPAGWHANTTGNAQALTVTVKDASGQTITGTYANTIRVTDPDPQTTNGTNLTGTHAASSCITTCVDLTGSGDTVTLNYGGLAENPVQLNANGTGVTLTTATFTPLLNPITSEAANPTSQAAGNPVGVDLFTTNSSATVGYTGTVRYYEDGFTNAPYSNALSATVPPACNAFATVTRGAAGVVNGSHTDTLFIATAIASPAAGSCTVSVTDGLTDQTNPLPTFVVTYTTGSLGANAKQRINR